MELEIQAQKWVAGMGTEAGIGQDHKAGDNDLSGSHSPCQIQTRVWTKQETFVDGKQGSTMYRRPRP